MHIACQMMYKYNPHFVPPNTSIADCTATKTSGAVTILLSKDRAATLGHIAVIVHDDHDLALPSDLDTTRYMSFWPGIDATGPMLTGTKARYAGFGTDLENVTEVVTLYNVDTDSVLKKWDNIKKSAQMFDAVEWNCARTAIEVLNAGHPNCLVDPDCLWTPKTAFEHIKKVHKHLDVKG